MEVVGRRPVNGRLGLRAVVWLQAKVRDRGLGLRPRLYTGSVYADIAAEAAFAATVALYTFKFQL